MSIDMKNVDPKALEKRVTDAMYDAAIKVSETIHQDLVGAGKETVESILYPELASAIKKTIIDEVRSQYGINIDIRYNLDTRKLENNGYKLVNHTDLGDPDASHPSINDLMLDLEARRRNETDSRSIENFEQQIIKVSGVLTEGNAHQQNFQKINQLVSDRLDEVNKALKSDVEKFAEKISKGEKIEKPNKRDIPLTVLKVVGVIAAVALVAVAIYALNIYVAKGSAEVQAVKNSLQPDININSTSARHGRRHGHHSHGHHGHGHVHHGKSPHNFHGHQGNPGHQGSVDNYGHHYGWASSAPEAIVETVQTVATVANVIGFNTNMVTIPLAAISMLSMGIYHSDTISTAAVDASRKIASALGKTANSIKDAVTGVAGKNTETDRLKNICTGIASSTQELTNATKETFNQCIRSANSVTANKAEESLLNQDSREIRQSFNDLPRNMDEYLMRFATHEERKQYLENDKARGEKAAESTMQIS